MTARTEALIVKSIKVKNNFDRRWSVKSKYDSDAGEYNV